MFCPQCQAEHASGPSCASCGYAFVFDRESDGIDDREWLTLLEHAGANGSESFTENRLYALYAERHVTTTRRIGRRAGLGFALMAIGFAGWVRSLRGYSGALMALSVVLALCGVAFAVGGILTERHLPSRAPLADWLGKWQAAGRDLKWLSEPRLDSAPSALVSEQTAPPERLVIVERDLLVDWLLENDVARELGLLIVSERGYPQKNLERAQRALAQNPSLSVLLLHDATFAGTEMKQRVERAALPALRTALGGHPLLDAGLFPADIARVASVCQMLPEALAGCPLDMLPREAVVNGLRGVLRGELLLVAAIDGN
ncbi:MAG TPA: hypothetical protein VGM29_16835 [Polyangiaceae bacterium]